MSGHLCRAWRFRADHGRGLDRRRVRCAIVIHVETTATPLGDKLIRDPNYIERRRHADDR